MAQRDTSHGAEGASPSSYPSLNENPPGVHESQGASGSAKDEATGLKQKLSEDVRTVQQAAKYGLSQASDKARDVAGEQKNIIAMQLGGLAAAVEKAAGELEDGDHPTIGNMTRRLGTSMRKFADDIRERDLRQVAHMAEDLGRRRPAAFLGMAALAGFAVSRFLAASSDRETTRKAPDRLNAVAGSSADSASPSSSMEDRSYG
ncbi:hypothetical protein SAMN02982989_5503 [Xaviernesmea oryzae]|uniref:Nutrient deprivation-induced protein n=1 Tax=Xaviernesmea oryzae TaxID=464029 RepID=A0A1X7DL64_9HYPH|nr:hypothetical protein [Xaviernesmea oryzae]SMF16998.1 hypothetical protein SAMN02982989_5503 [Xaviernesmea oryzae]